MSATIEITGLRSLWQAIKLIRHHYRYPRYHYREDGSEKVRYGCQETALKAADGMARKGRKSLDAYQCPKCHDWHLGGAE